MDREIKLRAIMKDAGFSLVELMIVVAIIGIIMGIASLSMVGMSRTAKLNESRDILLADIEEAKIKSISGVPQGIFVSGGNSTSYQVVRLTDANSNFQRETTESYTSLYTFTLNTNYRVSFSDADGELWFDRKGIPRLDNWSVLNNTFWIWYDSNGDTVRDTGEPARQIGVDNGGRIQYE